MGLHFIKNGTKHDVCVKRPSLFPASATTYDNSQSGLSATRVQGAIDEVNEKVDRGSVSVTADGVKTYSQVLDSLYSLIDKSKLSRFSALFIQHETFHLSYYDASTVRFGEVLGQNANRLDIKGCVIKSSGSVYNMLQNANLSDLSSQVPGNGVVFTVEY